MTDVQESFDAHARSFERARRDRFDRGASLVEYALLVSLIAIVCLVAVMFFGSSASETFSRVGDSVAAS